MWIKKLIKRVHKNTTTLLKKQISHFMIKTKHSKLSVVVHSYTLKGVGGLSNTVFSSLLEFINQLLSTVDEALPNNTYEAKRFLRDMGLGYEKIFSLLK
jgi:hypothetical protein